MGRLNRALVDRARLVRRVTSGERVEGQTPMVAQAGEWMACRIVPGPSRERPDDPREVVQTGEIVLTTDAIDVRPSDTLQVQSQTLGDATWNVTGLPQRATGTRQVRAVVIPVERTVEPMREDA